MPDRTRTCILRLRAGLLAAAWIALAASGAPGQERNPVPIDEWTVPWPDTRPRDPYVAPDGSVWFVGQTGDYIARLDPASGEFERRDLPEGTGPHNLIVGGDGTVWIAGNRSTEILALPPGPDAGYVSIPMPDPAARDPHTLAFGPDGEIWFSVQNGNFVGRLLPERDPAEVRLVEVPTPNARPYGIVVGPDGRPWFAEFAAGKIGTVDPVTMRVSEISLPRPEARPRRLVLTSDGAVWYADFAGGYLGRIDPADGSVREWPTPAGEGSRPYAMVADDSDRIWFVETGPVPNRLVGFAPARGEYFSVTEIPSGAGSVRHVHFEPSTGEIWFGTDAGTVGRARLRTVDRP
ncbi:MAG: lyase [Gemmatimonadota bacterium]